MREWLRLAFVSPCLLPASINRKRLKRDKTQQPAGHRSDATKEFVRSSLPHTGSHTPVTHSLAHSLTPSRTHSFVTVTHSLHAAQTLCLKNQQRISTLYLASIGLSLYRCFIDVDSGSRTHFTETTHSTAQCCRAWLIINKSTTYQRTILGSHGVEPFRCGIDF